ncbi:myophilin [Galendromus occidentalis]|uniref:Transgelin n=1 Tax=Galendromus occidentalis TaxID=34638 RepID=A0AAJ6VY31_9ACAR|nr:myophilin [Galendromus occidentalis]
MAENRAPKSGLAAEAQKKLLSKYDNQLASEVMEWVRRTTGGDFSASGEIDNVHEVLKDGVVLCKLMNVIKPGAIPEKKISSSKMAFKCMENIGFFLQEAKDMGVLAEETFQTVDLWEKQNILAVVICLQAVARKASKYGIEGIGPKESEGNRRNFSEEVLKAGQNVIGLQYGSNKGASQSGMNFGNTRHM